MSEKSTSDKSKKPVEKFRDGGVEVAVWRNESEKGTMYTVTHRRSYKQGDEWHESDSYGKDDILVLRKQLDLAHSWILNELQQQRARSAAA